MSTEMMATLTSGVGVKTPGAEVKNLGRDQATVISLMWQIDWWEGGQLDEESKMLLPILSGPDGKCPDNFIAMVKNFQAVNLAKGLLPTATGTITPTGASFELLLLLSHSMMPKIYALASAAKRRQEAANRALALAMRGLTDTIAPEEAALALGLVNRFYKVVSGRTVEQQKADIAGIQKVFNTMSDFLATVIKDKTYFHESPGGHREDGAYTYAGHWANRKPEDGIWFVKSSCRSKSEAWLLDLIIHECAHFCGDRTGGAWCIDHSDKAKRPYGEDALKIAREDCLQNAANYAWFAGTAELAPAQWKAGNYAFE